MKCSAEGCYKVATFTVTIRGPGRQRAVIPACTDHTREHRENRKKDGRLAGSTITPITSSGPSRQAGFGELIAALWFGIDSLHESYDNGEISADEACEKARVYCLQFLEDLR